MSVYSVHSTQQPPRSTFRGLPQYHHVAWPERIDISTAKKNGKDAQRFGTGESWK